MCDILNQDYKTMARKRRPNGQYLSDENSFTQQYAVRLTKHHSEILKKIAVDKNVSPTALCREIIQRWLEINESKTNRITTTELSKILGVGSKTIRQTLNKSVGSSFEDYCHEKCGRKFVAINVADKNHKNPRYLFEEVK